MQKMSFSRSYKNQNVIFLDANTFQNLTCPKSFISKSNTLYFFQSKIWRVVQTSNQNLKRCENFDLQSDKFQNFFSEILFLSCFSGSDLMMISTANVNNNLFQRGELKENACFIVSRQMDKWKLPHFSSSLNVWGIALWQHTNFAEVTDRTLRSLKYSRSAVFFRKHLCENERKRSLVRIPLIFSNVFVWATRMRAIERSWHLHSIYPILAAGRYLPQSWHLWKLTMPIRKSNFKICAAQNNP